MRISLVLLTAVLCSPLSAEDKKLKALIIDGQNNHRWKATTPYIKSALEDCGRFTVDVATSPAKGKDMSNFNPEFKKYDVVVSNYNGAMWNAKTRDAFVEYVRGGGGFVTVHAANNSFGKWALYNEMIGLGGWGGRNAKSGPYVRFKDGKIVRQNIPGRAGSHGRQHAFAMTTREAKHPIMAGLPEKWMHTQDELYDRMRGPAKNLTVLATAYSDKKTGGTGEHEPLLMTIDFGKGRVFHTALGHGVPAMKCIGFRVTLARGCEWAATGKVTVKVPQNFPTADKTSSTK